MLAGAVVASSLGYFLGKLWKGEWKQRQLEMESAVRNKIDKMAKELQEQIYQHHQRDYITYEYPQRSQKWLPKLSPSCSKIVEGVLHEIGSNLEDKAATRLSENFSTETTTANSRRSSSRLNSLAEISWRARDSVSSVLLKQEIENQLQGLQSSPNQIPGIQISRIETIDLDRASAGSSGSSMKRFIIVHGDLTSSQFSFTSEYSLLSSNARSRSSNEASLLEFSPRESEWDADVSLCSRDSQTSIAYSRSSRGSGREVGRIFYHQYLQQQPQQQQ
ncbi:hypothetical protein HELRODRAFT_193749, partial [Helobdella robusta]|uniref:Uncharacterized protein n=1 Tax=Helobdella robusta TaxID=6412 RepID=T1FVB3_HELRO